MIVDDQFHEKDENKMKPIKETIAEFTLESFVPTNHIDSYSFQFCNGPTHSLDHTSP